MEGAGGKLTTGRASKFVLNIARLTGKLRLSTRGDEMSTQLCPIALSVNSLW